MINPARPGPMSRAAAKAKVAEMYARMAASAHARASVPSSPLRPDRSPMTTQTVQGADGAWRVELRGGRGSLVMSRPARPDEIPVNARRRADAAEGEHLTAAFGAVFRPDPDRAGYALNVADLRGRS